MIPILRLLHVLGAIFLVGGVTTHTLLRPVTSRAADSVRQALYQHAWRIQVFMVYTGSAVLLITGILLWVGRFRLFTGWLLLGVLLFVAAMGLDGAFLSPNLRRARSVTGESSQPVAAAAMTIQVVELFLLLVVVYLMVTRPF